MKQLWSSGELSKVLGITDRAVRDIATKGDWPSIQIKGKSGRPSKLYSFYLMPKETQSAVLASLPPALPAKALPGVSGPGLEEANRRMGALLAVRELSRWSGVTRARELVARQYGESPTTLYRWDRRVEGMPESAWAEALVPGQEKALVSVDGTAPENLKGWQRDTMDARLAILREVERRAAETSVNKAVASVVEEANAGNLPPMLQDLVPTANARSGKNGAARLSRNTLFRWRKAAQKGIAGLAPKDVEKKELPAWFPLFLKHYRVPSKVSVAEAMEEMAKDLPQDMRMPTESQVRRAMKKFSRLDIQRGRRTGSNLSAVKGHIRRDTSRLLPLDVVVCDGHSFKARVAHPTHGRPFHPEVCGVIDAATRVFLGWSAGLAESSQTVADALRHAITVTPVKPYGGIPAIFYTDKGAGNMSKPLASIITRMDITHQVGRPGNAQGRGIIENPNKSIWIRAAKKLPTCTHKDMDSGVARTAYLQTNRDVKKTGRSDLLPSWPQFLDYCQQTVDAYNNRPHSALPKVTDPETRRRRHMTPLEMWAVHLAEGFRPETATEAELVDLFRPCVKRTCNRCEVTDPAGNIFYSRDLEHYHGERVFVHYDVHDPSRVWVRDSERRLICIAEFEKNKRSFFPVSVVEQAVEKRAAGRARLLEQQLDLVEAERRGLIDVAPEPDEPESNEARVVELAFRRAANDDCDCDFDPDAAFAAGTALMKETL